MGSKTLCRCECARAHTCSCMRAHSFYFNLPLTASWCDYICVEHLLTLSHQNEVLWIIWKWWRFKWPSICCILLAMTLGDFGFLNTHCMLTVVNLQCERVFLPLCWNNLITVKQVFVNFAIMEWSRSQFLLNNCGHFTRRPMCDSAYILIVHINYRVVIWVKNIWNKIFWVKSNIFLYPIHFFSVIKQGRVNVLELFCYRDIF